MADKLRANIMQLQDGQRSFLAQRNRCTDCDCVKATYESRLREVMEAVQ